VTQGSTIHRVVSLLGYTRLQRFIEIEEVSSCFYYLSKLSKHECIMKFLLHDDFSWVMNFQHINMSQITMKKDINYAMCRFETEKWPYHTVSHGLNHERNMFSIWVMK
jgi:hypothetical protein